MDNESNRSDDIYQSRDSIESGGSSVVLRNRIGSFKIWRPNYLVHLVSKNKNSAVLHSVSSSENIDRNSVDSSNATSNEENEINSSTSRGKKEKGDWHTIVTVVLVEARGLPDPPEDGSAHSLSCKIRLGAETFKSKYVSNIHQPEWRERFQLHLYKDHLLRISLWDKGKAKNFMGSCVLDLCGLEKERTHEIWQELDDGYGLIHLSVTMCVVRDIGTGYNVVNTQDLQDKYALFKLENDWKTVGQLYVKIVGARGLSGRPSAYCTLELDNERVQTHNARASSEPVWDKNYLFNVYDVTSTLDLKVYDSSSVNPLRHEALGKISIPLLRICNGEMRWYALKNRNRKNSARGNCPRVLVEMTIFWNPVKASIKLFQPKEVKHIKKPPKFDIPLLYKNLEFIRDTFLFLYEINESFKRLFEWDNQELSFAALAGWLIFWGYFELWTLPLLLSIPFFYFWLFSGKQQHKLYIRSYSEQNEQNDVDKVQNEKRLTGKIQSLPEMTIIITNGIAYLVSVAERLYNLASFKVPFLSYLTLFILIMSSIVLRYVPVNYLFMAFGIYKFTRKYLHPDRTLNNDLLDFISRVPDNEILREWKELSVPEPVQWRHNTTKVSRSNTA